MKKFFVKKYIPVYQEDEIICIGYAGHENKYIELVYSEEIINLLNQAVKTGIKVEELSYNSLFSKLHEYDFLEELDNYLEIDEINRDKIYFQYLNNYNFNESIFSTNILIFGAGAGGSTISYMLAQMGFKNLIVIDNDIVTKTDTIKSYILNKYDIGMPKVEAIYKHIKNNFDIDIRYVTESFIDYESLDKIIHLFKPDFIVKACDPELIFRTNLNEICFKNKIPFINMAYAFEKLRLGPLYIPGFTNCDEGFNELQKKAFGSHYDFQKDKKLFTGFLAHPSILFNVNMLASFILKEIVMYFTEQYEYCFTIGRLVEFNPLSLEYQYWDVNCSDTCKICKPLL